MTEHGVLVRYAYIHTENHDVAVSSSCIYFISQHFELLNAEKYDSVKSVINNFSQI